MSSRPTYSRGSRDPPSRRQRSHSRSRSRSPMRRERDEVRDSRSRTNGRDRNDERDGRKDRDRRDDTRRRDGDSSRSRRSPPSTSTSTSKTTTALPPAQQVTGGDGGWGNQNQNQNQNQKQAGNSPGRPSKALPSQAELTGHAEGGEEEEKRIKVVEPNFGNSGALAAETNTFQGVVLKYNEPPEARKPVRSWRLYVFKGKEQVDLFHVHRQSAYLIGRDRIVTDIPIDHPSTSKQHAVLQFRQVIERNEFGETKSLTKPFIIDLESANGTTVNDEQIPTSRYYELKSNDALK